MFSNVLTNSSEFLLRFPFQALQGPAIKQRLLRKYSREQVEVEVLLQQETKKKKKKRSEHISGEGGRGRKWPQALD